MTHKTHLSKVFVLFIVNKTKTVILVFFFLFFHCSISLSLSLSLIPHKNSFPLLRPRVKMSRATSQYRVPHYLSHTHTHTHTHFSLFCSNTLRPKPNVYLLPLSISLFITHSLSHTIPHTHTLSRTHSFFLQQKMARKIKNYFCQKTRSLAFELIK